jgi:hypothetical protein
MRVPTTSDLRATEWGSLTTTNIQKYGRAALNVCDALCAVYGLATIDKQYVLSASVVAQGRSMGRQSNYLPQVDWNVLECGSLATDRRRVTKYMHACAKGLDL